MIPNLEPFARSEMPEITFHTFASVVFDCEEVHGRQTASEMPLGIHLVDNTSIPRPFLFRREDLLDIYFRYELVSIIKLYITKKEPWKIQMAKT